MCQECALKGLCIALGFGLIFTGLMPSPAAAQKIIRIESGIAKVIVNRTHVRKVGRVVRSRRFTHVRLGKRGHGRFRFSAFALPDQTLFPPYYDADRQFAERPDMRGRIAGGRTVRQGSRWRSSINGGETVEAGSRYRSHIKGGRTVQGGSRWASRIPAGRSVEQGSPWRSTMPNWRFSGYAAPMRPKGIPYYRSSRAVRSPWASRM